MDGNSAVGQREYEKGVTKDNSKVVTCSTISELGVTSGGPSFREREEELSKFPLGSSLPKIPHFHLTSKQSSKSQNLNF